MTKFPLFPPISFHVDSRRGRIFHDKSKWLFIECSSSLFSFLQKIKVVFWQLPKHPRATFQENAIFFSLSEPESKERGKSGEKKNISILAKKEEREKKIVCSFVGWPYFSPALSLSRSLPHNRQDISLRLYHHFCNSDISNSLLSLSVWPTFA